MKKNDAKPIDYSLGAFSDDLLYYVMRQFGYDDFTILPFFSLNGEVLNLDRRTETARKVFIETCDGIHFLKEVPWYCSTRDFVAFSTSFQNYLTKCNLPVPTLRESAQGEFFVENQQNRSFFVLHEYIEGEGWKRIVSQAEAAGEILAKLHDAARKFKIEKQAKTVGVFESSRKLVELLYERVESERDTISKARLRKLTDISLHELSKARADAINKGYGSESIVVHGDFNPFNLLYSPNSAAVCAILDFDNCCEDDIAHDLAEALIRYCWMKYRGVSSAYAEVPTSIDAEAASALLASYRCISEPSFIRALPLIPSVGTAVALELAAIGLLSGYYCNDDIDTLTDNAFTVRDILAEFVNAI